MAKRKTAPPATAEPVPVEPAGSEIVLPERRIALEGIDWFRATFRPRVPLVRPTPPPFDRARCLERLAGLPPASGGWDLSWYQAGLTDAMTREEAAFWLAALTSFREPADRLANLLRDLPDLPPLPNAEELDRGATSVTRPPLVACCLAVRLGALEYLELLFDRADAVRIAGREEWFRYLLEGLARHVIPYLREDELEPLRRLVRSRWNAAAPATVRGCRLLPEVYVAALLGMPEEIAAVCAVLDRATFPDMKRDSHFRAQDVVLGLGSAERVAAEWKRLALFARDERDARGLIACVEYAAPALLRNSILERGNRYDAAAVLKALTRVEAPEAAPVMLECLLAAGDPGPARRWLVGHAGHAIVGLIPVAAGRGKLAEAALEVLSDHVRRGHADLLAACLNREPDSAAAARVRRCVLGETAVPPPALAVSDLPAELRQALADEEKRLRKRKPQPLPDWAEPAVLPPLKLPAGRLADAQGAVLLAALAARGAERSPLVAAVRNAVDGPARDEFARLLFRRWNEDGRPQAAAWALTAAGLLGGDGTALDLAEWALAASRSKRHDPAGKALIALAAIGSDFAWSRLANCGRRPAPLPLRRRAGKLLDAAAAARRLSRADLEDRLVSDCGLDPFGRREFSFGRRVFAFELGNDLAPLLRGADGLRRKSLPKTTLRDDAEAAARAAVEWDVLRLELRGLLRERSDRLESDLRNEHRRTAADFMAWLVRRPLPSLLVRRLVWAGFDAAGRRTHLFRVTDELDLADANDHHVSAESFERVGLAHPADLPPEELARWRQVLDDYEIVPPFPQLERPVHAIRPDEEQSTFLDRIDGVALGKQDLLNELRKRGWRKNSGAAGEPQCENYLPFATANLTAVVTDHPVDVPGSSRLTSPVRMVGCRFLPGLFVPVENRQHFDIALPLGKVPPAVLSEVLTDLLAVLARGEPLVS